MCQVTIYTAVGCGPCVGLKAHFKRHQVPFVELNVSHDDTAREELLAEGIRSTPVVRHGKTFIRDMDGMMALAKDWKG